MNIFKNEIIHFFNIDIINSSIYIYLEIEGKRIKSENSKENFYKLDLRDLGFTRDKKELNVEIVNKVELNFQVRIINKIRKKKSKSFCIKLEDFSKGGISIKDKIKIFSGEYIKKEIFKPKIIPGKLKIPLLFMKEINTNKEIQNDKKENKNNININGPK